MSDPDKEIRFIVPAADPAQVAQTIHGYFTSQKYRIENGQPGDVIYGIGSDTLRMLLGAFVKRYKFYVGTAGDGEGNVVVTARKAMSGAMGGLIGHSAMKKETARIFTGMRQLFGQS